MSDEGRGRSAHDWSSQTRVGSLSRIGYYAENQGTIQKKSNAPDVGQEHFLMKIGRFTMDELQQKYNDYLRLKNCRAEYLLSNGMSIDFVYKVENFIHLLGLHKLTDIQLIQLFNDRNNKIVQTKYIISRIKKNKFTDEMVKSSVFYPDIESRYESFSYDNLTTLTYTDAIINFNPTLIKSRIKSKYLLFEQKANHEYNHLGIAEDGNTNCRYIETFFHQTTDMYIKGQTVVKVESFTLYSPNNQIIVTDSF